MVLDRLRAHPSLLADTTAEKMTFVLMSNIGWQWDCDDVGRKLVHAGTPDEDYSAWSGLVDFIGQVMQEHAKGSR